MNRLFLIVFLVVAALPGIGLAQDSVTPVEIVRRMRIEQDSIATKGTGDAARLRQISGETGQRLLAMPSAIWKEPRNVKAACLYVLTGGNPRVLRTILGLGVVGHDEEALATGALAYGEGDDETSEEYLLEFEPRNMDAGLAGVVALVQAVLVARDDPKLAIKRLDEARLLAPGTLVEEAALRRQALLSLGTHDLQAFENLALQYLRRFSRSIYAEQFRLQFAVEVAKLPAIGSPEGRERMAGNLAFLPARERLGLFLAMAAEGATMGKLDFVMFASARAMALAADGTSEMGRARLYDAAMKVVTKDYDAAAAVLRKFDPADFDISDQQILAAALEVASAIRRPEKVALPVARPPDVPPPKPLRIGEIAPKPPRLFAEPPTIPRAQKALAAADQILKGRTP